MKSGRKSLTHAIVLLVLTLSLSGALAAQDVELAEKIEAALAKLGPHPISAVRVVSLRRGEVLYERNADLSLNPASNMKLFTSLAAFAIAPAYSSLKTPSLELVLAAASLINPRAAINSELIGIPEIGKFSTAR